jgi:hypothetical protein
MLETAKQDTYIGLGIAWKVIDQLLKEMDN